MSGIAAFDFDKTLSSRTNTPYFVLDAVGALASLRHGIRRALAHPLDPHEALLASLRGQSRQRLAALGESFAEQVVGCHLDARVLERLESHRQIGHRVVVVSAGLDVFLEPVAELLGLDALCCSRLDYDGDTATGRLSGPRMAGRHKAAALRALRDPDELLVAYGNGHGDHAMFSLADAAWLVTRRGIRPAPRWRR